jgi:hypothetical protein
VAPSGDADGTRRTAWVLLRAGLVPALVAGAVVVALAVPSGSEAVTGAAVGTLLTVTALAAGPLLLRAARDVEPLLLFALAAATYLVVVTALGVAYALLSDVTWLDGAWVGGAVITCAAAWLAGQVRATAKLRVLTFGDRVPPG